jgi:hypothetical protein
VKTQVVGLAAAAAIANAFGGRLSLDRAPMTALSLMLPKA